MNTIICTSVQDALQQGSALLLERGNVRESRAGRVLALETPLAVEHLAPAKMVLADPDRDANPFLHLFEFLWMIAGRADVEFVAQFAKRMREFSDDGLNLNGAYGWRWRQKFGFDQLHCVAQALRENPECRRQVLTMWGPDDLRTKTKDMPCNLQVIAQRNSGGELNLMVTNRSNDLVWGMFGSDSVHFSLLLQYLAAKIGCPPGGLWQVSMNTHAYERHWPLLDKLARKDPAGLMDYPATTSLLAEGESLFDWEEDLSGLFQWDRKGPKTINTRFFRKIVWPMWQVHAYHAAGYFETAVLYAADIEAADWRVAVQLWLAKRAEKRAAK